MSDEQRAAHILECSQRLSFAVLSLTQITTRKAAGLIISSPDVHFRTAEAALRDLKEAIR